MACGNNIVLEQDSSANQVMMFSTRPNIWDSLYIQIHDYFGQPDRMVEASIPVYVRGANHAPILEEIADTSMLEEDTLALVLKATDQDNNPITYSAVMDTNLIKYTLIDSILELKPVIDWYGQTNIKIKANDTQLSDSITFELSVINVNDPPSSLDSQIVVQEDGSYQFSGANFVFNDPESDNFAGIKIISSVTKGALDYNGSPVTPNTDYDNLNRLIYSPAPEENGAPYTTFTFQVKDDQGGYSDTSYSMEINVLPFLCNETSAFGLFKGKVRLDNCYLDSADWIAAFDEEGNCCGMDQVVMEDTVSYINLSIYGDDTATPDIDEGMNVGENFFLKLWDYSENTVIPHQRAFDNWENTNGTPLPDYNNTDISYIFFSPVTDSIVLDPRWNLISFSVVPDSLQPGYIFSEQINSDNLIYLSGFDGEAKFYDPNGLSFLNTLDSLKKGHGYWIKVEQQDTIIIEGQAITEDFHLDLNQGWNLIAYWLDYDSDPGLAFSQLVNEQQLVYASGFDGGAKFYDPEGIPILNTLTQLQKGSGYWIKTNTAVQFFEFPPENILAKQNNETFAYQTSTPVTEVTNNYTFVNGKVEFIDLEIDNDLEIQVIDQDGNVVAILPVVEEKYLLTTAIYGDDQTTDKIEGVKTGDILSFRYGDNLAAEQIKFTPDKGLRKVDLKFEKKIPQDYKLYDNYPNPFNASTIIKYDLPEDCKVLINVYDINGNLVQKLINQHKKAGYHQIKWQADQIASGMYFYRIKTKKFSKVNKCLLIK